MDNEKEVTISTHNGSQYRREHNRRNPRVILQEDHIDPEGHFEVWLDKDPREVYEQIFGQAVKDYNEKQPRADRKIDDYYGKICKSEKQHAVYEMIIGIYGRNPDGSPVCSKAEGRNILRAFVDDWQRRNPSLELIGAYYHADEEGQPHVHLDYVCVGRYSTGQALRASCSRALQDMGFKAQGQQTEQMQWQARENQHLGELCARRGLTVLHPGSKKHLDTEVFKAQKQLQELQVAAAEVKQELQQAQADLETTRDRESIYGLVKDVMQKPDQEIEPLEVIPGKPKTLVSPERPQKVVLLQTDFDELKNRALVSTLLRQAYDRLAILGEQLKQRVCRSSRYAELEQRAQAAEIEARQARLDLDYARVELQDTREEMHQQQDALQRAVVTRDGRTLWDLLVTFLTKEREREIAQEQVHSLGE